MTTNYVLVRVILEVYRKQFKFTVLHKRNTISPDS